MNYKLELERVFALLFEIGDHHFANDSFRGLLNRVIKYGRHKIIHTPVTPSLLPFMMFECLGRNLSDAVPIVAAVTAFHLGADLFDDWSDGDLSSVWDDTRRDSLVLVSVSLMQYITYRCVEQSVRNSNLGPTEFLSMVEAFQDGQRYMAEGQHLDLTLHPEDGVSLEQTEDIARLKTGEQLSAYTKATAIAAGLEAEKVVSAASFGRNLGIAIQLANDLYDVHFKESSPDLLNGSPTLPIVHAMLSSSTFKDLYLLARYKKKHSLKQAAMEMAGAGSILYTIIRMRHYASLAKDDVSQVSPNGIQTLHSVFDYLDRTGVAAF